MGLCVAFEVIQFPSFNPRSIAMHAMISGSMTNDTLLVLQDQFRKYILTEQVHMLSVASKVHIICI